MESPNKMRRRQHEKPWIDIIHSTSTYGQLNSILPTPLYQHDTKTQVQSNGRMGVLVDFTNQNVCTDIACGRPVFLYPGICGKNVVCRETFYFYLGRDSSSTDSACFAFGDGCVPQLGIAVTSLCPASSSVKEPWYKYKPVCWSTKNGIIKQNEKAST